MWLLLQGWLPRNVLTLLGWLAGAAGVATVLFGVRQAGRIAERVERMRRTVEVQRDQLQAASRRPRDRGELARRMRRNVLTAHPVRPLSPIAETFLLPHGSPLGYHLPLMKL